MASAIIGRTACPECDFKSAHIKIKTDKEGAKPYRHCPECGAQYFARNQAQGDYLRQKMRPEGAPAPDVKPVEAADVKTDPPEPQKYKMVFGTMVPV